MNLSCEPPKVCPACKGKKLSYGHLYVDVDNVWQTVTCKTCNLKWNEVYIFMQAEDVNTCQPLDENGKPVIGKVYITNTLLDMVAKKKLSTYGEEYQTEDRLFKTLGEAISFYVSNNGIDILEIFFHALAEAAMDDETSRIQDWLEFHGRKVKNERA